MAGKKLLRGIFGRSSDCKKDDKNQRQRQSTSMVQRPVEHQAVSNTFSLHSAAARPEDTCHGHHDTRNEQNNTFQQCIHEGDQEDIDTAASVFIDRFRRDLEMQRALSNALFKYTTVHDVLEVSKSAYDSCSTTNPTATNQGGSTTIVLASTGNRYFICGTAGHCAGGMKLAITVAAAAVSTTGPATSPPPPSTITTKTPTSPPPPSSAAMAVSGVQIKEGVVLVGCLVLGALTVRML